MSEYFIYYTESNLVCVIVFAIMLAHDLFNLDRQEKQLKYDRTLAAFMLYFISDATWAAVVAGIIPRTHASVVITNFANYLLMAAVTYLWLEYVMALEQTPHRNRPINKFAVFFPFLVSTAVLIMTYLFAPQMLINDKFEPQLTANVFLIAVPIINIVAVIIYAWRKAMREENPIEKRRHLYIGFFPLMVVGGGLLQILVLPNTPVFCFASTILMLVFYIQSMDGQISLDPLTHLNNRGQLVRYVSQKSNLHKEGRQTYVVMIDVNDFKSINDTYGHAEGDHALVLLADALRTVINSHSMPLFLGRYGGDEFILILHPTELEEVESIAREIRAQIESRCAAEEKPYLLSVGIGYDELLPGDDTFQKCQQRADHKLYLDKEYIKRGSGAEA